MSEVRIWLGKMVVDAVSEMHDPVSLQQYCWPEISKGLKAF